jgi:hypothetical protein
MVAHRKEPERMTRAEMILCARAAVEDRWPEVPRYGRGLHLASAIVAVAAANGTRLVLQAGSMRWRRLPVEEDDGVVPTHFSYEWEQPSFGHARWFVEAYGCLPEVHVWAGDPERQEIVDLSTGTFPEACAALADIEWRTERPPSELWCRVAATHDNAQYEVNHDATMFAHWCAHRLWNG